jgi:hypothetical protein
MDARDVRSAAMNDAPPRTHWLMSIAVSWWLFGSGLVLLGWADWSLRMRDGHMHDGGIPEWVQHALVLALGLLASALSFRGTSGWRMEARLVLVAMQAFVGFWVYVFAAVAYVCGTGIDCF